MKRLKTIQLLTLSILLLVTTNVYVSAQELEAFWEDYNQYTEEEMRRIEEAIQSPDEWLGVERPNYVPGKDTSRRDMCLNCEWFMVEVCLKEADLDGKGYHEDILGLTTTDCYADFLASRYVLICPTCGEIGKGLWTT